MKSFNDFIGQLFAVGLDAELPQQLPVPRGGFTSFSPDDSKMAFNRIFREFRTWKHYRGGMADDEAGTVAAGRSRDHPVGPGQQNLFHLGPGRPDESFLDQSRIKGNEAANELQGLRH